VGAPLPAQVPLTPVPAPLPAALPACPTSGGTGSAGLDGAVAMPSGGTTRPAGVRAHLDRRGADTVDAVVDPSFAPD
jgi:hypothetical protein